MDVVNWEVKLPSSGGIATGTGWHRAGAIDAAQEAVDNDKRENTYLERQANGAV